MDPTAPNIVFVFPDEYRAQAVGYAHADPVRTPNLDRLASEGVVFTHAISNRPVCSPYRAMLMTGTYPHRNGVLTNCNSETADVGNFLSPSRECLTDVLAASGYATGYIGKWHLDAPNPEHEPFTEGRRGDGRVWDSYTPPGPARHGIGFWHAYGCCDRHLHPHYWEGDAPPECRIDVDDWSVRHETDVAVAYIRNRGGAYRAPAKPFCLFVAYNPPHMPFHEVPPEYVAQYRDADPSELLNRPNVRTEGAGAAAVRHVRDYFAACTGVDDQFGRILAALDDEGLAGNTIVVFTSDHGEMMGSHGMMHKTQWYDESLLVPFVMRWPDRLRPRTDDLLLSVPDIMPTLLGLAGLRDRCPGTVSGTDLSAPVLTGAGDRPDGALYLNVGPQHPSGGLRGWRTHRHMYVCEPRPDGTERVRLYDSRNDPFQLRDISGEAPGDMAALRHAMLAELRRVGDPWADSRGA